MDGGLTLAHGATNTKTDGVFPEARYTMVDGDYKLATGPSSGMPLTRGPYPHPDVTRLFGGSVAEMVEVKFPNNRDRYRKDQRQVYDDIAKDNGVAHKTLSFPDDCDCEQKPKPVPVPAPAPQEEEESNMSKVRAWAAAHPGEAIGIGVVVAVGVGALIFFSGGAAAPALAAAL